MCGFPEITYQSYSKALFVTKWGEIYTKLFTKTNFLKHL